MEAGRSDAGRYVSESAACHIARRYLIMFLMIRRSALGYLSLDEFCICMHLIKMRRAGAELPDVLPETMLPPAGKV